MVRRAERGIGVAIRRGQEKGRIAKRGDQDLGLHDMETPVSAAQVEHPSNLTPIYAVTDDVTDEQF